MAARDVHRRDAGFDAVVRPAGEGDEFQPPAAFGREREVGRPDAGDAAAGDGGASDRTTERRRRENREFVGGIEPLDVVARIGFREPAPLRFGQRLRVTRRPLPSARG